MGTSNLNPELQNEISRQLNRLADAVRQELKTAEPGDIYYGLRKEGMRDESANALVKRMKNTLVLYEAFLPMRELEMEDKMLLKVFLQSVYQKWIVRYESGYLEDMLGGEYDKLIHVVDRIQYLTDFYIYRRYTLQEMVKDLMEETGLSRDSCTYWADLIEQNYTDLKMNYIVSELARMNRRLSEFVERNE